ncbi:MAG: hypothetical protein O3A13_04570 [Proteobacteria bacterium]|nr:hypothetical protein [Pseudomonadota bacterium]MDA0992886.1 hypothetical protein [Pseudomonadota bacterium]
MPRLVTFIDLQDQQHTLGLHCIRCNRWGEADIDSLISSGLGGRQLTKTKFRCQDCGAIVDKQLRPPVPEIGNAVAYIHA